MIDRELVLDALAKACGRSTTCVTCQCGVTHFSDEDEDANDLKLRADKTPSEYREHDHWIHWFDWGDQQIVVDCECRQAVAVGHLLWDFRGLIVPFLQEVAVRNLKEAASQADFVETLPSE